MTDERCLARGAVERIGESESKCIVEIGDWSDERTMPVPDHGVAVAACLEQLTDPRTRRACRMPREVSAIGFKAVHGGRLSGVFRVDDEVLDAMAEMNAAAPAHNPPYIAAMRSLRERFPELAAGGGVRDRFSPDDSRGPTRVRDPTRVGRRVSHSQIGIPRCQSSLHRHAQCRVARPRRCSRDLLSPRWQQQFDRDRRTARA